MEKASGFFRAIGSGFAGTGMSAPTNGLLVQGNVGIGGTANTASIAFAGFQMNHGGGTSDGVLVKFTTNCLTTSIDGNIFNDEFVSVFPNPAASELRIQNAEFRIENVEVFDVLGQKYNSAFDIQNSALTIDVSALSAGIYFVKVRGEKGESVVKFMKQ